MSEEKHATLRVLDALQMKGFDGKREYVASLERRGDEQAVSLLVECLCDESTFLRELAERALTRMGEAHIALLRPLLTQGLWYTRASVARVLGGLGAKEALPDLVTLLTDANGAIADADYLDWIIDAAPALFQRRTHSLDSLIRRSVDIKSACVAEDPRESGKRAILNFGHTIGHALEQASGYAVPHGHGVAIGMLSMVVPAERLDAAVDELLAHLLAGGPQAHARIKDLIRAVARRPIDDALIADTARRIAEIRASPEGREGIAAFLEKRKAGWCSPES